MGIHRPKSIQPSDPHGAPMVVKAKRSSHAAEVTIDRRKKDRRAAVAAGQAKPAAVERRQLERRTKVARRRQIDPTTCERDYSVEEVEFMRALEAYKRTSGRMFPTCSEVLEVIRALGYEKRCELAEIGAE